MLYIYYLLTEKDDWEYQLSFGVGDEKWEVHAWL